MPKAAPHDKTSTHHLILTLDGVDTPLMLCDNQGRATPLGFAMDPAPGNTLKIYSGEQKFSDMELPWVPVQQEDWSGGRGQLNIEDDATRFLDSRRMQTWLANKLVMGGQTQWATTGLKCWPRWKPNGSERNPIEYYGQPLKTDYLYEAVQFTADATSYNQLTLILRRMGSSPGAGWIKIYSDSSNHPGSVIATGGVVVSDLDATYGAVFAENIMEWLELTIDWAGVTALSIGTKYWIVVYGGPGATASNHYDLMLVAWGVSDPLGNWSANGSTWLYYGYPMFHVLRTRAAVTGWPFEYRKGMYVLFNSDDGSAAPSLYLLGDMGLANSGSTTTLVTASGKGTATWALNEAEGGVIFFLAGAGSVQKENFSTITSNTATSGGVTTFTFEAVDIAPASGTEYVIIASDKLTALTTGWAAGDRISDILVANGFVYFARGEAGNISRYRAYNSGGTWTHQFADDGTNKATLLWPGTDYYGAPMIWKANLPATIARAPIQTSWANLAFGTAIPVGDQWNRISGLCTYENGDLWVIKEDSWWRVEKDIPYWLPIGEMHSVADYRNGRALLMHGVYLYASLLNGLERYFNEQMDGVGPDKDEGLPVGRCGPIVHLVGLPGMVVAAVDAGKNGYSSIHAWNRQGWHEIWRAGTKGRSITQTFIKPIAEGNCSRLYFSYGDALLWIPISLDPLKEQGSVYNFFNFNYQGVLHSSRIYSNLHTLDKYWHSIIITHDSLVENDRIGVDYKKDSDSNSWTNIGTIDWTADMHTEIHFSATNDVTGEWVQYRLRIEPQSAGLPIKVHGVVVQPAIRVPVKSIFTITFRALDDDIDIHGRKDPLGADARTALVKSLAASKKPALAASVSSLMHGNYYFVDSCRLAPFVYDDEKGITGQIGQATLFEV